MFRTYVARGLRAALDSLDAHTERLDETVCDRGLHLLSYGLRLDDAWADARDLALAPHLERQRYRYAWIEMLEQALKQAEAQGDDCGAAHLHLRLGRLYILLGDYATADAQLTQAQQLAAAVGDRHTQALALERLGYSAFERSDLDTAQTYAEASLALVDTDSLAAAGSWHLLGWVATRHGEFDTAIGWLYRALNIYQKMEKLWAIAAVLRDLGVAYLYTKRYDLAGVMLEDAIARFVAATDIFSEAVARMNLGNAYWYLGKHAQALATYAPCEVVFQQIAGRSYLARLYNNQGLAYREMGEVERARERFDSSLELARGEKDYLEAANVLDSLAGLRLQVGDTAGAISAWQEALSELAHLPEAPRYLYNLIQERMEAALRIVQTNGFPAPGSHSFDATRADG